MNLKNAIIDLVTVAKLSAWVVLCLDKPKWIVYVLATIEVLVLPNPAFRTQRDSP
jgi:hypothetical protein